MRSSGNHSKRYLHVIMTLRQTTVNVADEEAAAAAALEQSGNMYE